MTRRKRMTRVRRRNVSPGELRALLRALNRFTLDIPDEDRRCDFCHREVSFRFWGVCRFCFPFFDYMTLASARPGYQRAI